MYAVGVWMRKAEGKTTGLLGEFQFHWNLEIESLKLEAKYDFALCRTDHL
jgi:hypothetical protein